MPEQPRPDPKKVFIIYGRNSGALKAVEGFLKSLALIPWSFQQVARDQGLQSHIGEIVRKGMAEAHGIIALFTPEEFACLDDSLHGDRDEEVDRRRWQARPNVIFEAGMAYGLAPERTTVLLMGPGIKLFSDLGGIQHLVLDSTRESRSALRRKLRGIGCDLDLEADAWLDVDLSCEFRLTNPLAVSGASDRADTSVDQGAIEKRARQGDTKAIDELIASGSKNAFDILSFVMRQHPSEIVRYAAIAAMVSLGDDRSIGVLGEVLANEKGVVAQACAQALGRSRDPRAASYLIRAIGLNVDRETTQASAEGLGLLPPTPASLRALVSALNLGGFEGKAGKQSLVNFGSRSAPVLRQNLERAAKGEGLQLTVEALALIGDKEALPGLNKLAQDLAGGSGGPLQQAVDDAISTLSDPSSGT